MPISRRRFLRATGVAGLALAAAPSLSFGTSSSHRIDRRAVVRRHNPVVTQFDPYASLSVGNGEFAFTADITGLQTFAELCDKDFPNCTMAHWAWHSVANPEMRRADLKL